MGALVLLAAGCGEDKGTMTSRRIADTIAQQCGVAEGREAGGPRTITPVDEDGSHGVDYFLVTCVNGRVAYVKAP